MRLPGRLFFAVFCIVSLTVSPSSTYASFEYQPIDEDFQSTWERNDRPVLEGDIERTWLWGPGGYTGAIEEPYVEAPDETRKVQYFDKSRMELTYGERDADDPWSVTQGLLARELITGYLQLGDDYFEQHLPAEIPVAGDPDDQGSPRYSTFTDLLDEPSEPQAGPVISTIDADGGVGTDDGFASFGITYDFYAAQMGRNVASVFWELINAEGPVLSDGDLVNSMLFPERFYAIGYPLTDPYWAEVQVNSVLQPVLIQCFERRCLTYTPGNEDGWQVEAGNVGQHYFQWRYEHIDRANPISPPGESRPADPVTPIEPDLDPGLPTGEISVTDRNLTIGEEQLISVVVTDELDQPVTDAPVTFDPVHNGDSVAIQPGEVITDEVGRAETIVSGENSGTTVVDVSVTVDDETVELGQSVIVVQEPEEVVPVDVSIDPVDEPLPPGESTVIEIIVSDPEGEPVAGVDIDVDVITGEEFIIVPEEPAQTNDNGVAEIEIVGTEPGDAVIEIEVDTGDERVVDAAQIVVADNVSATATVSNPTPSTRANVTVSGSLTRNGQPVQDADMTATWYFRTVTSACSGQTDASGNASCTRQIGAATPGYTVLVRLAFYHEGETYSAWTSFTPQ